MPMEKTFDAAEAEQRLYKAWEEAGAFKAGAGPAQSNPDAQPYSIMIPPPNVTGSLHMGHAFNNTLQDILVRWKRMQGFDTLWQPGTDHAGIATQMVTEREMTANQEPSRREMGRDDFLKRVWQQKIKSRETIIGQLKRLGASCDWSREAFTMSGAPGAPKGEEGNFHDAVIKVFVDMYNKGLIYRGKRLVNWDPHFETAISDLEVENIDVAGHMWHFKYPLAGGETYEYVEKDEDGEILFTETRDYISIATTRPETMLGDGAVAVHPLDERYAPIVGKLCEIPVGPKEQRRLIPIITDEYPDRTFGSGAVKITGAHDFNDYAVAKRNFIPCYRLMDTRGAMRADGAPYVDEAAKAQTIIDGAEFTEAEVDAINLVPEAYRGLDRFEARERVIADITAEGLAVMTQMNDPRLGKAAKKPIAPEEGGEAREDELVPLVEAKTIMQPFGDRSKVVIEPMLTDQWFVDTAKIVGPALDAVRDGTTQILPEREKKVYFHWLENIEPWCISRQLWWGHQIPVWHTPGLGGEWRSFCAATEEEALAEMQLFFGDEADFLIVEDAAAAEDMLADMLSQGTDYTGVDQRHRAQAIPVFRDPDVLDTWFSSGLWPIGTLGWPEQTPELNKYFPTSDLITGTDILFFWVARMMMMQLTVVDQVPFKTVYLHGLVRDAKGKKMSKSLGNVVDPLDLIDEFGTDALRFTNAAMASVGGALKLDTQRIAGYRNFSTKLWNACRFAEMNGVFQPYASHTESIRFPDASQTANKWIIGETAKVLAEVNDALENYRFNDAASALYAFVWGKVCDWYVEFSKPLFDSQDAEIIAETRATMAWVLDQCLILLHPIMPFITEELWGTMAKRDQMLIHADWPTYQVSDLVDETADSEMTWVISLIDGVRSARAQMHVPAGLQVPMLVTELDAAGQAAWDRNEALIKRLARIDSLDKTEGFPKGCVTVPVAGGTFGLPLAGIIDVAEEKARLEKTLGKLGKEIGGLKGRLNNPKFAESAPEEVVEEARDNLNAREEEETALKAALARLAELG
ncbi:valine--tRNA ligase [Puniceibacterium sediminis]|uniref:Valine--tRNA ligase n=1 Tax=Puniceibacterium sediminis TaxID=1608407 RepID=A0A238UYR5_9RHOB|nr:valine--tRNA ligase [Puniceibacterium sediminis]SNR26429.1 valyl-tRNA synthetase [Puniceibacterium sediminis]